MWCISIQQREGFISTTELFSAKSLPEQTGLAYIPLYSPACPPRSLPQAQFSPLSSERSTESLDRSYSEGDLTDLLSTCTLQFKKEVHQLVVSCIPQSTPVNYQLNMGNPVGKF